MMIASSLNQKSSLYTLLPLSFQVSQLMSPKESRSAELQMHGQLMERYNFYSSWNTAHSVPLF